MRLILVMCLAAGIVACGKKEQAAAPDPVAEARKALERVSEMPDVSIHVAGTPGPALAQHLVDHWAVYGITPDRYAMAESMVMVDDLPPEAVAVGVKGTAGFHFQGAGPYFREVLLAYAVFDSTEEAEHFLDNLSDSNAAADGVIMEKSFPMGREDGPQINFRCAIVPDSGNSLSCYYQDFTGQIVTTLLFGGGPATDPGANGFDNEMMDALDTVLNDDDLSTRVFDFGEASSGYLARVTKQIPGR